MRDVLNPVKVVLLACLLFIMLSLFVVSRRKADVYCLLFCQINEARGMNALCGCDVYGICVCFY